MTTKPQFSLMKFLKSFIVWFAVFYGVMLGYEHFFGTEEVPVEADVMAVVEITTVKGGDELAMGNLAQWTVSNPTSMNMAFSSPCEADVPSLKLYSLGMGEKTVIEDFSDCGERVIEGFELEPEGEFMFSFPDWNEELFVEEGTYALEMTFMGGDEPIQVMSEAVVYENPNMLRRLFRAIISQPLFNLLVVLSQHMAFGWAIVVLTIIVRLALFFPNQNAMKSQRRMQQLQPKLDDIRAKHGKNQQELAAKTMELYKTHKVSPMSSCWPMLIQLPIMLGVYWIVRDGLSPHLSYLLYNFNMNVDFAHFDEVFLGLNLTERNIMVLPFVVAVAQWIAVKLSMVRAKKQKKVTGAKTPNQMEQMNKMMLWVMPVMMGFFTATFPAAASAVRTNPTWRAIGRRT